MMLKGGHEVPSNPFTSQIIAHPQMAHVKPPPVGVSVNASQYLGNTTNKDSEWTAILCFGSPIIEVNQASDQLPNVVWGRFVLDDVVEIAFGHVAASVKKGSRNSRRTSTDRLAFRRLCGPR